LVNGLTNIPRMAVSTTAASGNSQPTHMSKEEADLLYEYQMQFDKNKDPKNAYQFFKELNKHGMHVTVIRQYYKHDLQRASPA